MSRKKWLTTEYQELIFEDIRLEFLNKKSIREQIKGETMTTNEMKFLTTSHPLIVFEDNGVGRLKKQIFDAPMSEINAILQEYEIPSPSELGKGGCYIQTTPRAHQNEKRRKNDDRIEDLIASGKYQVNDRIPTESELADMFGVGPVLSRAASCKGQSPRMARRFFWRQGTKHGFGI
jgi:hypothetical protein